MKYSRTDILAIFSNQLLCDEERTYIEYHSERLAYTINLIQWYTDRFGAQKILDIGPHFLTCCIHKMISPQPSISTLGYKNGRLVPDDIIDNHFEVDLNECANVNLDEIDARYDLIIFSETIEHLHTSPKIVLSFLKGLLNNKSNSGILLQTPNATSIEKRIKMLFGKNPYELIREDEKNPGHFREYTMKELEAYTQAIGCEILYKQFCVYWSFNNYLEKIINIIPSFRRGLTIILVRG